MNSEESCHQIDKFSVISKVLKFFVMGLTVASIANILAPMLPFEDLLILAFSAVVIYSLLELGN